ncbi:MAG: hypothetical protein IT178_03780 [Acidobacteria bacterium]|nr:hypothetical protein [Acidobacteriota bacterium]
MVTRSEFERELQLLEVELRRLEAEYNQFFAGRAPRLPWDLRTKVDAMVKRIDRMPIQNTGDRFRFQTIQSRWAAFGELWERQLKAQETGRRPGRPRGGMAPAPMATPPPPPRSAPAPPPEPAKPREGVVASARLSNPAEQGERVQALYQELAEARRAAGEKPVEFDRFQELVKAQVKKLGADGGDVTFRVTVKGGKVTMTAKTGED